MTMRTKMMKGLRNGIKNASKDYDESDEPRPPKPDFDTKLITQGLTRQHLTRGNHLYCICNRVVGYCTSICPCYKANIGCTDKCEMVPEANDFVRALHDAVRRRVWDMHMVILLNLDRNKRRQRYRIGKLLLEVVLLQLLVLVKVRMLAMQVG